MVNTQKLCIIFQLNSTEWQMVLRLLLNVDFSIIMTKNFNIKCVLYCTPFLFII